MTGIDLPDRCPKLARQWPFQPRFARVNGWRMHYVDEGAGDPVVLLHGNPTWGFLYRDFVAPLTAAGYRVIIPDMIGFGLSEKPVREQAHSLDGHIANLTGLLRRPRSAPHHAGLPRLGRPDRPRLRAVEYRAREGAGADEHLGLAAAAGRVPHAHLSLAHDARAVARAVSAGAAQCAGGARRLSVGGRSQAIPGARAGGVRSGAAGCRDPPAHLDLAALDSAGRDARAHSTASPGWSASFRACTLPALLIWGREDDVFDPAMFIPRFRQLLPHAEGPHLVTGRHFLQEDSGPEIAAHHRRFPAAAGMTTMASCRNRRSTACGSAWC